MVMGKPSFMLDGDFPVWLLTPASSHPWSISQPNKLIDSPSWFLVNSYFDLLLRPCKEEVDIF